MCQRTWPFRKWLLASAKYWRHWYLGPYTWPCLLLLPSRISLYFPRPLLLGNDLWCTGLHDTIVQMIPQFFPGMASPQKVLICRAAKYSPDVFIKYPTSAPGWVGVWGWGGCPGGTHPIWLCRGRWLEWLSQRNPPSPSGKGDLLVIWIRVPISYWVAPRCQWGASGGAFSSQSVTSWQRSSIGWHSSWLARLPRSAWRWCRVPPPGWGLPVGKWSSPPLRV